MNPYLLNTLEAGPVIVGRLLRRISPDRLDEALVPGRFTPREVVAHLADWEPIMRERLRRAERMPGCVIEAYDEGEMAVAHRYADSVPDDQLALFARERDFTAEYLRGLDRTIWSNTVTHPDRGLLSIDDLANLLLGHDLYHIEQISAYL